MAVMTVVDHERGSQAEQGFGRKERDLSATRNRATGKKGPELLSRLADCQPQVVGEVSHSLRLLLAVLPWSVTGLEAFDVAEECLPVGGGEGKRGAVGVLGVSDGNGSGAGSACYFDTAAVLGAVAAFAPVGVCQVHP